MSQDGTFKITTGPSLMTLFSLRVLYISAENSAFSLAGSVLALAGITLFCAVRCSREFNFASITASIKFPEAHLHAMLALFFLALAGLASAHPASLLDKRQSYLGTATFNDYSAQGNTNCGPKSGMRPVASLLSHRCRLRS